MNKMKLTLTATMAIAVATLTPICGQAQALTVVDVGATAPTDYTYAETSHAGSGLPPSNATSTNNKAAGETFTISNLGSLPAYDNALELTQIDIKDNDNNGGNLTDLNLTLTIGTVSSGTFTATDTESVTGVTVGAEDYIDLTLSDYVVLHANTTYAFFITTNGALHLDGAATPVYSGDITGSSAQLTESTDAVTLGSGGSRNFYLETVPVPEPADWALVPVIGTIAFFGLRRLRFAAIA
jgi:hypothetical protein